MQLIFIHERAAYGKLRSLDEYRVLLDAGAFAFPPLPEPAMSLDTSALSAKEAALRIAALVIGDEGCGNQEPLDSNA